MKKIFFFLLLLTGVIVKAQNPVEDLKSSPNGYFEKVFDQYGNQYDLKDLQIEENTKESELYSKSTLISCDSGIFELYFETGSGMDDINDAGNNLRRDVVCRVFKDISDFIITPLKTPGNTEKVRIWVRNIGNTGAPSGALGMATSFYTLPNATQNIGGIIDGEVYKTIIAGKDSFFNIASPLVNGSSQNPSGKYYHGMMAFNFSGISWNTDLTVNAEGTQYDLYSIVLHEIAHALGFNSLLNYDGTSVFGSGYKYYTRYDRFLKNHETNQFLLTTYACSNMYNNYFNTSVPISDLYPNCNLTPPVNNVNSNSFNCSSSIKFVGTNTVPVYTPNCFERGSSFSHFEDRCITNPANGTHFAMSNAQDTGSSYTKRYLKKEERTTLLDIGYNLNVTYGNSDVNNSQYNYDTTITGESNVIGLNDGLSPTGTYTFVGNAGATIPISGILSNDYNAVSFRCLEGVYSIPDYLSNSYFGVSGTTINFRSTTPGLHLLRYIPVNANNKEGNITYIYVYVLPPQTNYCARTPACNLIFNGDFEQYSSLPTGYTEPNEDYKGCNWGPGNIGTPDYFHVNASNSQVGVPCNMFGFENANNSGLAYGGMIVTYQNGNVYTESLKTKLASPLQPNTVYELSFYVSLSEGSWRATKLQAFLTKNELQFIAGTAFSGELLIPSNEMNMLFTNPTFTTQKNGWEKITFIIPQRSVAGEEYLYLGGLKNIEFLQINPTTQSYCGSNTNYSSYPYYYIDNVSLTALSAAVIDLPTSICNNVNISNLENYISGAPTNGVFSGPGVSNTNGVFSFNSTNAGIGTHTITYTYTNSSECSVSINGTITVVSGGIIPTFTQIAPVCEGETIPVLPGSSNNDIPITGTWTLSSTTSTAYNYTFTPNAGQCATSTSMTITILDSSDPSCASSACQNTIVLSTPESNANITYRALNSITTNTNYTVNTGKHVTLKCENVIYLQPGTFMDNGADFFAKIQPCADLSKIEAVEAESIELKSKGLEETVKEILLFPNPTDSNVTVKANGAKEIYISIYALDGKLLYQNQVNDSLLHLDMSSYRQGIYLVNVKTDQGLMKKIKLLKQ